MRTLTLVLVACVAFGVAAPGIAGRAARRPSGSAHAAKHIDGSPAVATTAAARFGFELFSRLRRTPGNAFYSPLSVEMAMAMAGEGAAGETARQMRSTLHLSPDTAPDFAALSRQLSPADTVSDLAVANALWADRGTKLRPEYRDRIEHRYGGELHQVEFDDPPRASAAINGWVGERTHGLIRDLVPPGAIQPRMRLILTNAVFFKGRWANAFDPSLTKDQDFAPLQGSAVRTPFMLSSREYRYAEDRFQQVLEIPYAGGRWSMLVMLPRRAADLALVEKGLTFEGMNGWLARLKPRVVEVHLPRFRLETYYELEKTLAGMGMPDAFDPRRADFSGISGGRDLFIGMVTHKAFVEVDEKGTTAAAATGVMMPTALIRPASEGPVVFRADHPFVFLIRDSRSGAVMFVGRLARPGA